MNEPLLRVSHAILLVGPPSKVGVSRANVLKSASVPWGTFRSAAKDLGAYKGSRGLAFFDASEEGKLAFGPGAGLAVGVSVGAETVRAVLVDANGWQYYPTESDHLPNQLSAEPSLVLGRIRETVSTVIDSALTGDQLDLVDDQLPMLGCAVAWPTPIDRDYKPVGQSLAHNSWRSGTRLTQRVEMALDVNGFHSYALNDAHAAAIAIAHRETHQKASLSWNHPMVTVVVRIAGNVAGAVIVLEPPRNRRPTDPEVTGFLESGFLNSILIGGVDNMAGEIGHVPVSAGAIAKLNRGRPPNLGRLTAQRCACSGDGNKPKHLEAFASVLALTQRVDPKGERRTVLRRILEQPEREPHKRALEDLGGLVGDTLVGAVGILNPAKIMATGSLALPVVWKQIKTRVEDGHSFGSVPSVGTVPQKEEDYFLRARGAALALIRNEVHRKLDELVGGKKAEVTESVAALTVKLAHNPLKPA